MHDVPPIDPGRVIDWSRTSSDYAAFRAGIPESFWRRLEALDVVRPGLRVLDLGTGTGNVALMTCHVSWLPRLDEVARRTEELVLRHDPRRTAGDWAGRVPAMPSWAADGFELTAMFWDEAIPFTRESWRGRIRACRGVGASLAPEQVAAFDADHARLLEATVPAEFTVLHRIDAHVLAPRG